nr:hypothetical protein [Tanacetum cinerariifolium]
MNDVSLKAMQNQIDMVKNELRNEMKTSIQTSLSNQTNEIQNMMASLLQMNIASTLGSGSLPGNTVANPKGELKAITTRSGLVTDGPTVPTLPKSINPEEDGCVEETPLPSNTIANPKGELQAITTQSNYVVHQRDPHTDETLTDLELAEYTIKVPPPLVQKAKPPSLRNYMFTFPADFVIFDYESDPQVPLIFGRPFLRTARALIDIHGEEMILRDGDERLTLNMRHDTSSYSNQPPKESINMINIYDDSREDYLKDLFAINHLSGNHTSSSHTDLTSPEVINPLSGSTTSSSPDHFLEEFADELALITFPLRNDDLPFDIESDIREIEYLLNHDPTKEMDSILEDSVDENNH